MRLFGCFTGIGGFELGFERAGFELAGFAEVDPYCCRVLARHWPAVPNLGDVRGLSASRLARVGRVDVLTAGVPCGPASVAGSRLGSESDEWLWPELLDVVRLSRPRWLVAENPVGLVSLEPDGLQWVCGSLHELGFDAWPVILSAHAVGAPHLRERVWIVAHADGERCEEQRGAEPVPAPCGGAERDCRWPAQPGVGRVAHGLPCRVDRIRALGNALIPKIAELLARAIVACEAAKPVKRFILSESSQPVRS